MKFGSLIYSVGLMIKFLFFASSSTEFIVIVSIAIFGFLFMFAGAVQSDLALAKVEKAFQQLQSRVAMPAANNNPIYSNVLESLDSYYSDIYTLPDECGCHNKPRDNFTTFGKNLAGYTQGLSDRLEELVESDEFANAEIIYQTKV